MAYTQQKFISIKPNNPFISSLELPNIMESSSWNLVDFLFLVYYTLICIIYDGSLTYLYSRQWEKGIEEMEFMLIPVKVIIRKIYFIYSWIISCWPELKSIVTTGCKEVCWEKSYLLWCPFLLSQKLRFLLM